MFSSILYDAKAHIKGGREYPDINGYVYFKNTKYGVLLTANIHGLPLPQNGCNGRFFGFHIHERNFLQWKS